MKLERYFILWIWVELSGSVTQIGAECINKFIIDSSLNKTTFSERDALEAILDNVPNING